MTTARIMVIEDDPDIRELFQMCFTNTGITVDYCTTGTEVLTLLQAPPDENPPGIIISDFHLPGANADAFLPGLRQRYGNTRIIVFAGLTSAAEMHFVQENSNEWRDKGESIPKLVTDVLAYLAQQEG